uniref:protein C19orf12 homolog isoform X1 n=1 Tax=Myxine glutinosa TaxID=7769 RepID=UPI00358ECD93
MVIRTDELLEVAGVLARDRGVQVAFTKALQGAAMAGAGAFMGALFAGPVGIAIGGTLGGLVGATYTKGQFRPLGEVLAELPPAKRQQLATLLDAIVSSLDWTDAVTLAMLLNQNGELKGRFFSALTTYVQQEMQAQVRYVD